MLSLPTLFLLMHLPQADLKSLLYFVLDAAVDATKTTFEVAVAVSGAVEEAILYEVEDILGHEARKLAEVGLVVYPLGPRKVSGISKIASKSVLLNSSSGKAAVLTLARATRMFANRRRYSLVGKDIQIQIDKVNLFCDLVALGPSITCVDIIRDPTREVTARHQAAGFGDGKEKKARLSGPGASDSARALGIEPGDSISLQTEIWLCVDDATCREWKAPKSETPTPKVTKPPRDLLGGLPCEDWLLTRIAVEVPAVQPSGGPWDSGGGLPDLYVRVKIGSLSRETHYEKDVRVVSLAMEPPIPMKARDTIRLSARDFDGDGFFDVVLELAVSASLTIPNSMAASGFKIANPHGTFTLHATCNDHLHRGRRTHGLKSPTDFAVLPP